MAMINLNKEDHEKIKNAVKEAESKTSGEIATAFIKESYDYALYELLFAVIFGFIFFFVMMFYSGSVESIIRDMFWDYSTNYLLTFFGLSTFLVIGIVYFLANVPPIDRLIIPKSIMFKKVNERAVQHFMESGVYNTKGRTGILIFISSLERRVELIADKGISEKVSQEKWDTIVNNIIKGIKSGELTQHLCESVKECGDLLAEYFPIQADDVNELKDGITILEK